MTLNQLRYVRVLADTEHYTKAADVLNIAQPSLSRAIALLEEELGVLLFTRRGRNVVLTDAGRAVAENIYEKHTMLTRFLVSLGVDENTAAEDACKMEHVISDTSFKAIKKYAGME